MSIDVINLLLGGIGINPEQILGPAKQVAEGFVALSSKVDSILENQRAIMAHLGISRQTEMEETIIAEQSAAYVAQHGGPIVNAVAVFSPQ